MALLVALALAAAGRAVPVSGDCECIYAGQELPSSVYSGTAYADYKAIKVYGTTCAPWDYIPDTPWKHECPIAFDFSGNNTWCQIPWCYVDSSCSSALETHVFDGQSLYFSYETCGGINCFYDPKDPNCPWDPYDDDNYKIHHRDQCACLFSGDALVPDVYTNTPYSDLEHVHIYGSNCAAWDAMPGTPYSSSCSGANWCREDKNWCQVPWCYVPTGCPSARITSLFSASGFIFYSYDTCRKAPDCYTHSDDQSTWHLMSQRCPYNRYDQPADCPAWNITAVAGANRRLCWHAWSLAPVLALCAFRAFVR